MKKLNTLLTLALCVLFCSAASAQIKNAYLSKQRIAGYKQTTLTHKTSNSNGAVTDSASMVYSNAQKVPFVTVEIIGKSVAAPFTAAAEKLNYNGVELMGANPYNLTATVKGNTLHFHFKQRPGQSVDEFKADRNAFLGEYTAHLQRIR